MSIYALSQRAGETCDAAGKAMQDVFAVLAQKGSKTIWSMPKSCSKYMKILDLPYLACFLLFRAGKKDSIFFAIPENHVKIKLVKAIKKVKKYQIICFINDLNAFRYGNADDPIVQEKMRGEAQVIGMADVVLMPNTNTRELLEKNGVTSRLIPVGIWDYLMTEQEQNQLKVAQEQKMCSVQQDTGTQPAKIAFAGNLNKSEFLKSIPFSKDMGLEMHLWGKLEDKKKEELPSVCEYHGVLKAAEVPVAVCTMDYGLVWDGTGKDEIEGGLGEYLKYNNSHKCGLYLASGIPAIVWKHSGMAAFIKEHECGIVIERLSELPGKIKQADYEQLKKNALLVSNQLQKGYYLKQALEQALGEKK